MGINGLLPKLKSISKEKHVSEYKRVGVDGYVWLHRGALTCANEICQNIPTTLYLSYCMNMVEMLLYYKVKPIIILDGGILPSKLREKDRSISRKEALEKALFYQRNGNIKESNEYFKKAVDITPEMAYEWILKLKEKNIEFIVSPFEADAQLAYLSRIKYIDCIITEDSDLIPYGSLCILYKMDKFGKGEEIKLKDLEKNKDLSFQSWNQDMIIRMCLLTGCDYLDSLEGIGIIKAHKLIKEFKTSESLLNHLEKNFNLPPNYKKDFIKSELIFKHQRVYDPIQKKLISLNPLPNEIDEKKLTFLGPILDHDIVIKIVNGIINPITKKDFDKKRKREDKIMDENLHENNIKKIEENVVNTKEDIKNVEKEDKPIVKVDGKKDQNIVKVVEKEERNIVEIIEKKDKNFEKEDRNIVKIIEKDQKIKVIDKKNENVEIIDLTITKKTSLFDFYKK